MILLTFGVQNNFPFIKGNTSSLCFSLAFFTPSDQGNRRPWDNNSESGVTCAKLSQGGSLFLFLSEQKTTGFFQMEQEQTKGCW